MKTFAKPILTTVNRKVPIKLFQQENDQNRPKLTISQGLGQVPPKGPYLDRANHQVVRFKGQNGQNEVIFEVSQEVQKWSK